MKYSLILLAVIFLSSTCKRKDTRPYGPQYEEDPGPERGTTAERLQGSWRIEDYLKDDVSIYNQMNAVANGSITLDKVYFSYTMAKKDNGWHESRLVYPWQRFFFFDDIGMQFDGADTLFCYWLVEPFSKKNTLGPNPWKITKLYQNSFYIALSTPKGNFKLKWKR
jgi:hypothetical protein